MIQEPTEEATGSKPENPSNKYVAGRKYLRGSINTDAELFNHYPESIREDARWLRFFCKDKCNGEHAILGRISRSLGLKDRTNKEPSDQYWYQVITGRYFTTGGDAGSFARYVSAFRGYARQQEQRGIIPHVDTYNWRLIRDYIDSRRTFSSSCRIGGIEGLSGSQKTWCGKHYASLHNHKETIHVEAPARATRSRLVSKVAELYQEPASASMAEKEVAIERFLKGATKINPDSSVSVPRTIIIDNVQRLLRPNVQPHQQPIFNYFHELQDDTGFCLILTWVPSFTKTITSGHPFWAQFVGRIGGPDEILRLNQALPKGDLLKFAREFKVADDRAALPILKNWSSTIWGIRVFNMKMEKARALATARGSKEITVSHLHQVDLEPVPAAALDEEDES